MAKVKNPILFSKHFGLKSGVVEAAGLIDPFLNVDTQLFIDPVLLGKSSNELIKVDALAAFRKHFGDFLGLLAISEREGDAAWRAAQRLLDLSEPPDNGLGYGSSRRSGSSRPDDIRDTIMRTCKDIVSLGSKDPEMVSLMGFFEENVGPDTISDFTTRAITTSLGKITEKFCVEHGIPTSDDDGESEFGLPRFDLGGGKEKSVILVPSDIVRELPIANDASEIYDAIQQNKKIRDRVNSFLGSGAKHTLKERKYALRKTALESADLFDLFLKTVKDFANAYDQGEDVLGYNKLKELLAADNSGLRISKKFDLTAGAERVTEVVHETINMFKHHVEKGNLWEALWSNGSPKKERASQLIYFAIADGFCKANNIDISPEANMGGGPIDFKFSSGYEMRVLVEMKRSSGTVRHGYEKQLEFYKDAARAFHGIFVIIDYGDLGKKLETITKIRAERLAAGEKASDIVVIDATPKESASKRS
ncbi:hypothetical protein [Burkholderia pseudomallei]|uniref:hypothetical protein n=1 Tax=Burkholderia pseudomallei TaxID=28450 RepID=UPI0005727CC8|nr:hypothetical protein [Burkholderia pseudomallei]APZ18365.1 hypothetical protein BGI47_06715 [Burkholderia pseudomallei]APZ24559.1 hypothetical protein BGI46_06710 [Burkholderia pseudomallei]MBM5617615.1 hypothetical protein [Burkholderia pseudomallei]MBM5628873.1 hypothetical protein [Burkholderia pseudomallei]MBM5657218.1 hypothetical protein [Burkholderia pseudomallei]